MDSDISNRSSDILRNVCLGRVMDDGSWTEVGRLDDVKSVTFHGEDMPEEFKTEYINLWNDVSFTVELESTLAKKISDEIYMKIIAPFLLQVADQLPKTEENCVCYANPDDHDAVEFVKSLYDITQLRILNDIVYTKAVKKGMIYLIPISKIYENLPSTMLLGTQATTTIIDEIPEPRQPVRDISWIRKQMKHCKNPMERKALEKELNNAFREKKKRRRK